MRRRNSNMSRKSDRKGADFVFLPLGGVGEIGMNLYLYGYGHDGARDWLIVDLGVTFGGEMEPGVAERGQQDRIGRASDPQRRRAGAGGRRCAHRDPC